MNIKQMKRGLITGMLGIKWQMVLLIPLLAGCGYAIFLQKVTVPHLRDKVATLTFVQQQCDTQNQKLKSDIALVNTQIEQWKTLSEQLQSEQDSLMTELTKIQLKNDKLVEDIRNQPTPQSCEEAIEYLRDTKGLQW